MEEILKNLYFDQEDKEVDYDFFTQEMKKMFSYNAKQEKESKITGTPEIYRLIEREFKSMKYDLIIEPRAMKYIVANIARFKGVI